MRASPWLISLAIATGLTACQPAQRAEGNASDAGAGEAPPPMAAATSDERSYAFQCGDVAVQATYRGQDSASVVVEGRTYPMASEPAASGARYGDGQGNVFWTKGTTEGTLQLKGEPDRTCTGSGEQGAAAPLPTAQDATAAGFRATGNEPGWLA